MKLFRAAKKKLVQSCSLLNGSLVPLPALSAFLFVALYALFQIFWMCASTFPTYERMWLKPMVGTWSLLVVYRITNWLLLAYVLLACLLRAMRRPRIRVSAVSSHVLAATLSVCLCVILSKAGWLAQNWQTTPLGMAYEDYCGRRAIASLRRQPEVEALLLRAALWRATFGTEPFDPPMRIGRGRYRKGALTVNVRRKTYEVRVYEPRGDRLVTVIYEGRFETEYGSWYPVSLELRK